MNARFFIAILVYMLTVVAAEVILKAQSPLTLLLANTIALTTSWLIYYVIRPHSLRPSAPTSTQSWLKLIARLALGLLVVGAIAYVTPLLFFGIWGIPDIWLPLRFFLPYILFIAAHILIPVTFWGIVRWGFKRSNQKAEPLSHFAPVWAATNVLGIAAVAYAANMDLHDTSGWAGVFTFPIYVAFTGLLIFDAVVFIRRASKLPKDKHRLKYAYLMAAALSLAPIFLAAAYYFTSRQIAQSAKARAETPISLQETQQLVATCKVEKLYRNAETSYPGYGSMELRENRPVLPGGKATPERRVFDVKYFDDLLVRVRSKEVQGRCGFVSVYDGYRARKPKIEKWITKTEAEVVMRECRSPVNVYVDDKYTVWASSGPNTTGILLSQKLGIWNDDFESQNIILAHADEATKTSLLGPNQAAQRTCYKN